MGNPDSIFHDLVNQDPTGLAQLVLGDRSLEAEGLPAGLPIVRRRDADALLAVQRGLERFLLHMECELGKRRPGPRLLEYAAVFAKQEHRLARAGKRPDRPIVSAVLRLHGAGRGPRRVTHRVQGIDGPTIVFRYFEVDVRGLRAQELLETDHPALWALVPLTRDGDSETVLERTVSALEGAKVTPDQRDALLVSSWVFASIVGSHRIVERLLNMRGLRDTPALRQIFEEGAAEGKAALAKILRARLGQIGRLSTALSKRIDSVTDVAGLERLMEIALDVESVAEFNRKAFPRAGS